MTGSVWSIAAVPFCVLIAFAFASVGMAVTTYMRSWVDFEYVTASTLPLFLFSATFYPLSSYGDWAWVVQLSPLYHGVAMVRALNLGEVTWAFVLHAGEGPIAQHHIARFHRHRVRQKRHRLGHIAFGGVQIIPLAVQIAQAHEIAQTAVQPVQLGWSIDELE